jgi:lysine N6-hydroxylase
MMQPNIDMLYDLAGVGVGPFNMSLAVLLTKIPNINSVFFDKKPKFIWHEGMLLPEAHLQVSFLKDLVTLVDPTNPYSFLAFLAKEKRLYQFLIADFAHVYRGEFNQYLTWVSSSLPNLHFNDAVIDIDFVKDKFIIQTENKKIASKHIVLGSGIQPNIPLWAQTKLGTKCFHNHSLMYQQHDWHNKRVVVIGGGQSGAEIMQTLLADKTNLPSELSWISSRRQFLPLDDSPFVNEYFIPSYMEKFHSSSRNFRDENLLEQKLASDGISMHLLKSIYQRIYKLIHIDGADIEINLLPDHEVTDLVGHSIGFETVFKNLSLNTIRHLNVDIVILCTGYRSAIPDYLDKIKHRIAINDAQYIVNRDYSIAWDGPAKNAIYVQNAARHSHGIADPNLSLMALRSATIINSLVGNKFYDIENEKSAINWQQVYPEYVNEDIAYVE